MNHWYAIKTKPKKEKQVYLQMTNAHLDAFLPSLRTPLSNKPLFPSYLFLRADLKNALVYRMVRFTRGVNHVLGDCEGPTAVADLIVETLREKTRDGSLIEQELLFCEGDQVMAKKGILQDLVGIIEKNMSDHGRIRVLYKWLNSSMRVDFKYTELKKVA